MRRAVLERETLETRIRISLALDGGGNFEVVTGIPFFDHMLAQLARHGGMDLEVVATGDLDVDLHHLVEDTGILLGEAFAEALGNKAGIERFSSVDLVLDEALVKVALDLSGRAYLFYDVRFENPLPLGAPGMDPQLAEEFFRAFVNAARCTLHIESVRGKNTHHLLEATFKGFARALKVALRVTGDATVPSTKGLL